MTAELEWDEEKFQEQQAWLAHMKKMSVKDLKILHKDTFAKLQASFNPRIPPWMPRVVWERRLFLIYAARHYHYPKSHPETKRFLKHVKNVLTHKFYGDLDSIDKQVKRALNKHSNFTRERIEALGADTVDRYLMKLGYEWKPRSLSLKVRQRLLWEYFNLPASDTWRMRVNRDGKLRRLQKPRDYGSGKLRDAIIENPDMRWDDFVEKYGDTMPSVTHGSFRTTRYTLKKQGFKLPTQKRGRIKRS